MNKYALISAVSVGVLVLDSSLFYGGMRYGAALATKKASSLVFRQTRAHFPPLSGGGGQGGGSGGSGRYRRFGGQQPSAKMQQLLQQLNSATTPEERQQILDQIQAERQNPQSTSTPDPSSLPTAIVQ